MQQNDNIVINDGIEHRYDLNGNLISTTEIRTKKTTDMILSEAAATYKERLPIYGENWRKVGKVLLAYFPDGVALKTEADFTRFYLLVLRTMKDSRYANNFSKGGHSDSIHDNVVYSAMQAAVDEEYKDEYTKT